MLLGGDKVFKRQTETGSWEGVPDGDIEILDPSLPSLLLPDHM